MARGTRMLGSMAAIAGGALLLRRLLQQRYEFRDRVVVIAGGSRGLGLVMARQLAKEGAKLALLARDDEEIRRAVNDVTGYGMTQVLGLHCDLRDRDQINQCMQRVLGQFGRIDVLINNAGVIQVGPLDHMTEADFREAMDIHFWAPLHATLAALPAMRAQGEGRIVNISSIGGKIAVPHLAPYCASKFALVGLSEALRAELKRDGIVVTSICPGLMRTGSHLNARFKGRHREEFTWFALFDALPGASIGAERAARQILDACRRGEAEFVVSIPAKLAVLVHGIAPGLVARMMAVMEQLLPGPTMQHETESFSGWESASRWAPSQLTRLADRASTRNNEATGREPPK